MKKLVNESLVNESVNEFDDGPVRPRVFAVITDLPDEEWQLNKGAYIVVAGSKEAAKSIWQENRKDAMGWREEITEIKEINLRGQNFYELVEPSVM